MTMPSRSWPHLGRVTATGLGAGVVALLLVIAWLLLVERPSDELDTTVVADGTDTGTGRSVAMTTDPVTTPLLPTADPAPAPPDRVEAWLGVYQWTEFVPSDVGSNQTMVHELRLDSMADGGGRLTGRLTERGFQTDREVTVQATPDDGLLAIEVTTLVLGDDSYSPGDILFQLGGDPAEPTTTLGTLATLRIDIAERGRYFTRQDGETDAGVAQPAMPGSFWAVDGRSFDLVEVDTTSGQVVTRIAGHGSEAADPVGGPAQLLQTVEVAADGRLWVTDCCEPAAGNIYGLWPDVGRIDDADVTRLYGLDPAVSTDGRLVAFGVLDLGIGLYDTALAEPIETPNLLGDLVVGPDGATGDPVFASALTWLDTEVLVVAVTDDDSGRSTLSFIDLSDPSRPVPAGDPLTVDGLVVDAALRADGRLLLLTIPDDDGPVRIMAVFDPLAWSVIDNVALPDLASGIDHDAGSGALLVSLPGSVLVLGPEGQSIERPGNYLDVAWR